MKLTVSVICFFAALVSSAVCQVPLVPGAVKISKIQPSVVKTPEYQITGGQNKRSKLGEWLEVEVEFETKAEEVDELTFRYTVYVERKLLDGEVTHVNIPKGRDHFSVVFVAPRSLERLTGGKPLTPAAIENVWVEVSRQGQVLDRSSFKPGAVPNLPHISGLVLNKNETPFAPLYFDRYEAIKAGR